MDTCNTASPTFVACRAVSDAEDVSKKPEPFAARRAVETRERVEHLYGNGLEKSGKIIWACEGEKSLKNERVSLDLFAYLGQAPHLRCQVTQINRTRGIPTPSTLNPLPFHLFLPPYQCQPSKRGIPSFPRNVFVTTTGSEVVQGAFRESGEFFVNCDRD
jgi:hypothetical protein